MMPLTFVVLMVGLGGDPPYPGGETNLTFLEHVRGMMLTNQSPHGKCAEFPESYSLIETGIEDLDLDLFGSAYQSSLMLTDPNVMSLVAEPRYTVIMDQESGVACGYTSSFIFEVTFELHEAHAVRIDYLTPQVCLEGPVSVCLDGFHGPPEPWLAVAPPGVYSLVCNNGSGSPASDFTHWFDAHFAVLDHPLDADGSGTIGAADLAALLAVWGACNDCDVDVNNDGFVDAADLAVLLSLWGDLSWPFELP